MARVVKRILLHNNRENEEIRESDFAELKQDVQTVRSEILTDLSLVKSDANDFAQMMHAGISALGDILVKLNENHEIDAQLKEFQLLNEHFRRVSPKKDINLSINSKEDADTRSILSSHQDSRQTILKTDLQNVEENVRETAETENNNPSILNKQSIVLMNLNEITLEK